MTTTTLTALHIDPSGHHQPITLDPNDDSLEQIRALTGGGYVETLPLPDRTILWLNDDRTGLRANPVASALIHHLTTQLHLLFGPVVLTGANLDHIADFLPGQLDYLSAVAEAYRARGPLMDRFRKASQHMAGWSQ